VDKDEKEGTSKHGSFFAINSTGWLKDGKELSQISEHKISTENEDLQVSLTAMGPTKEEKPAKAPPARLPGWQGSRQQTAPAQLQAPSPGFGPRVSIRNDGSGTTENKDIGNITDSTFSDMFNDNSEIHWHDYRDFQPTGRPKRTNATGVGKPSMSPKQNVRRETAPPQLFPDVSIINSGSGVTHNSGIGNIKNLVVSDVGNNNSKTYVQTRRKKTYDDYGR
jgi:hypothetical protein